MGYVLRAYRTDQRHREMYGENGITQARLARWLKSSQADLSNIENGRRKLDSLSKNIEYAQIIGIPPELLWFDLPIEHEPAEGDADRAELAVLRQSAGLTQEEFAERLRVSRSTVIRWEAGETTPQPHQWPKIAKVLGVARLRLAEVLTRASKKPATSNEIEPNPFALPQDSSAIKGDNEIERRSLLAATGAAALEVTLTSSHMRTLQALEIVTADSGDSLGVAIDFLNELVPHYSHSLATSTPDVIYGDLLQCRHYSSKLLQSGALPRSQRAELTVSSGWLSNLLAVTTSYMGDHSSALIWCMDAERRSKESGNKDIAAWAVFTRTMIAYYQGDMSRTIEVAKTGLQIAPMGSVARAKLLSHAMRAYATQGNAEDMITAKREATKAIADLPSTMPRKGVFSIALSAEPPYTATSLLLSGRFKEASAVTREVLRDAYSPDQPNQSAKSSNYARTLLILGLSEAGLGNVDEATSTGRSALDTDNLVWPTLVLAGKLDRALRRKGKANSTTVEYHNMYHDALAEYRTLSVASKPLGTL
ncbi:helix-turn-helix transcriptional regulator [Actinophytocola sp.]|uniref:helix-turn-helix transcriptional regulator n=1 Tax=Actinophytocola sp. TaxID=1872138 RepID=UPI0025C4DE63|nr:helix-turn-helix transcriptional regulator [Actinophytocola sp.]